MKPSQFELPSHPPLALYICKSYLRCMPVVVQVTPLQSVDDGGRRALRQFGVVDNIVSAASHFRRSKNSFNLRQNFREFSVRGRSCIRRISVSDALLNLFDAAVEVLLGRWSLNEMAYPPLQVAPTLKRFRSKGTRTMASLHAFKVMQWG